MSGMPVKVQNRQDVPGSPDGASEDKESSRSGARDGGPVGAKEARPQAPGAPVAVQDRANLLLIMMDQGTQSGVNSCVHSIAGPV